MNEEAKLMNELEHFDPLPLRVSYPAALAPRFESESPGRPNPWGIVVPDLPGCLASGDTQEEAMTNAVEAVELWTESAVAAGREVPEPSLMDTLARLPEYAGWTWFFVGSAHLAAASRERADEISAAEPQPDNTQPVQLPAKVEDDTESG